ncbi:phospholipase A2 inhibitor and Ly6/PLAUR domain-containing protein-like [Hyla sarda]|uniref:phospholipase A2 inhibitor and Ly6/PLAUR domain-containing protein-like n=1 Tax=Hyla sarda TaxID=327740 RepID=UPI0024C28EF3|nr:phospholipase A2 inhibitor and Ly6/PLAUR domain-containing protein-like [Hyla sarda]
MLKLDVIEESKSEWASPIVLIPRQDGQRTHIQLFKRCGFSMECNRAGTITSAQKSISKNTTCCHSDHCISPMPTLPSENNETNGLICESCYLKEYGSCSGKDHIACTGNATQCIYYTERVKDGNFTSREVLHGCTHPSLCENEDITVTYDDKIIQENKLCRIPSKSSKHLPNILCAIVLFVMWSKLM